MLLEENALARCPAALSERRPAEAESAARSVLSTNPQHPVALFFLGVALLAQSRPQDAIAPLEQAAQIRPNAANVETHLAMALRDNGQTAAALMWFERATSRQPAFALAFMEFGGTLRKLRRFAEAEAVLRRGLQSVRPTPNLDFLLGAVCLDRGNPAGAKAAFTRLLAMVPGHPEATFGLGSALIQEGEFERAAEQFRRILAREPRHVRALLHLGHCLMELGRWDEGVASLRATIQIDPKNRGHLLRMLVASGHGRFWLKRSAAAELLGLGSK
jgi:tetratricopeptide (TPR) repeat protein